VIGARSSLLLTTVACGGVPQDFRDCDDLDCRVQWSLARWPDDRPAVRAAVRGVADPTERMVLVESLTEAHPGETTELCRELPKGPVARRCDSLNARPHLWQIDIAAPESGGAGAGKLFRSLRLTEPLPSPWEGRAPRRGECGDVSRNTCQTEVAMRWAQEGRFLDAGQACLDIEVEKWRYECFFQAADASFRAERRVMSPTIELCLGTGPYIPRCLGHIAVTLAGDAPRADRSAEPAWRALNASAQELRAATKHLAPVLAEPVVDRMWASALGRAYGSVPEVMGGPLNTLEPAAHPHLRAAAAWRLWQLEGGQTRDAAAWVVRVGEALAVRPEIVDSTPSKLPEVVPATDYWGEDLPGEEALPRIIYMADRLRAPHQSLEIDTLLCVLEAAARGEHDARPLFDEALGHPELVVRWTAARLLPALLPAPDLVARARADADPLVRQRAEQIAQ